MMMARPVCCVVMGFFQCTTLCVAGGDDLVWGPKEAPMMGRVAVIGPTFPEYVKDPGSHSINRSSIIGIHLSMRRVC